MPLAAVSPAQVKADVRSRLLRELNEDVAAPLEHVRAHLVEDELLPTVTNFIAAHPSFARKLFKVHGYVPELGYGIGKGEVLVYFLYDNVKLGGTSSSIDVHVSGIPYLEIKAARKAGNGIWTDFRLGTDEFTAGHHLLYRVVELMLKLEAKGQLAVPEHFGNIPKGILSEVRRLAPKAVRSAEEAYFTKLFAGRVGTKQFLFFDTETTLPVYYGRLERTMLKLDRFSAGQTKLLFNPLGF